MCTERVEGVAGDGMCLSGRRVLFSAAGTAGASQGVLQDIINYDEICNTPQHL